MKAMTSFTVKSLRDSAARTVVTIAGVALAAALLVAVLSSYVSATAYLLRNEATAVYTRQRLCKPRARSSYHLPQIGRVGQQNAGMSLI